MIPALFLRADASPGVGLGHVMRCLALAQAWRDMGGRVHLVGRVPSEPVRLRLAGEGLALHEAPGPPRSATQDRQDGCAAPEPPAGREQGESPEALAESLARAGLAPGDWVAFDGYHLDGGHHRAAKALGARVLAVDDLNRLPAYRVDALLDQNFYADERGYATPTGCARLFGPNYALIRREFLAARPAPAENRPVRSVLVSMGGADPDGVTALCAEALVRAAPPGVLTTLLAGPVNPRRAALRALCDAHPHRLALAPPTDDMPGLLARTDLAVTAAGSTCWEMAFMGLAMLTVVLAPNQESIARGLAQSECALNCGPARDLTPEALAEPLAALVRDDALRLRLRANAASLVDGGGAARVARALLTFSGG